MSGGGSWTPADAGSNSGADDGGFGKPPPADDTGSGYVDPRTRVDQVTEVTTKTWFGRLRDSVIGALIGIVLVIAGIVVLSWNEKHEFQTMRGLAYGAANVVEADAARIDPARNGKLVHLSGALAAPAPARDPVFGPVDGSAIRLERRIEMYQWKETSSSATQKSVGGSSTTTTTYQYERVWSDTPIDSTNFHSRGGHINPPMQLRTETFDAPDATLGARKLDGAVLDDLGHFTTVAAGANATPPGGWRPDNGGFFRGRDPGEPAVGDARVSFAVIAPGQVSAIALQQGDRLIAFPTPGGTTIALAAPGTVTAAAMFATERSGAKTLAWVMRAVGFALILGGLMLMVNPLGVLVSVLPFLESVVDVAAFVVMFGLAVLITLFTVAIAHIVLQPVLSAGLLVAGVAVFVLCAWLRGGRQIPRVAR
jgi:hypothetical protein